MAGGGKTILILGATGMLGHTLLQRLSTVPGFEVHGTVRSREGLSSWFDQPLIDMIRDGIDASDIQSIAKLLNDLRPDVVINCIGVIKQLPIASDPVITIGINALFPHQLAQACRTAGARLIHISTDCVFSGRRGSYREDDFPDADDLYGRSKLLGEVTGPGAVTLRTSVIGHELKGGYGLVDWFLAQHGTVKGYTGAIYTGFPTVELARIIAGFVIPDKDLQGLYQIASAPISKFDLLGKLARIYGVKTRIEPYDDFLCDRSLDGGRFAAKTGYRAPDWDIMLEAMYDDYQRLASRRAGREG